MNAKERLAILKAEEFRRAREAAHVPAADDYSDMTRDEMIRMFELLQEEMQGLRKQLAEQNTQIADWSSRYSSLMDEMRKIMEEKSAQDKLIAELMQQLSAKTEQLAHQRKERYAGSSQKRNARTPTEKTHQEEKDDWDGNNDNLPKDGNNPVQEEPQPEKGQSERELLARLARKGKPTRKMKADEIRYHKSVTEGLPEGATDVQIVEKSVFEEVHKVIEHRFEIVHYRIDGVLHKEWRPEKGKVEVVDVVPGTSATSGMIAKVITDRMLLNATHYSKQQYYGDLGLRLCRQTLVNWISKGAELMKPLAKALKDLCLRDDAVVNCDETWTRVKVDGKYKKRYIWCLVNKKEKIAVFVYDDGSRGRDVLKKLLEDKKLKALQSDGYNAYMYLDDALIDIDHIGCLAHARAKFKYAHEQGDPNAIYFLDKIGQLYAMEDDYRKLRYTNDQIQRSRNGTETIAILGEMRSKLQELMVDGHPPLGYWMGKAVSYLHHQWDTIFNYCKDGDYDIDNNLAERTIRPLTGERKASLFFSSHSGAETSAICHTLHATCKAMGISFYAYLREFFRGIVNGRRDYENLLPQTLMVAKQES